MLGKVVNKTEKVPALGAYMVFKETDKEQGPIPISTIIYDSNGCYKDAKREFSGTEYLRGECFYTLE